MVAYNFQAMFVAPIRARIKRQTIRLPRKRHARPGEPVQLYAGLRTPACFKIIPDPVCIGVDEVRLDLRGLADVDREEGRDDWREFVGLEVNGIPINVHPNDLNADEYARSDGFDQQVCTNGDVILPFEHMIRWWLHVHGPVLFAGAAVRWEGSDVG